VAVLATSTWAALKGRDALSVEWEPGKQPNESSTSLTAQFEELTKKEGKVLRDDGDVDAAIAGAAIKLEAVYQVPFLSHAPMEPMNCTADVRGDSCEIWAPTQVPGGARSLAAEIPAAWPQRSRGCQQTKSPSTWFAPEADSAAG